MKYFTTRDWIGLLGRLPPQSALLNLSSLRTLTGLTDRAVRQACWRLSGAGLLRPLGSGWYANSLRAACAEEIGGVLVRPSYVSLDSVLSAARITTQPCFVLTCVTIRQTTRRETPFGRIEYRSVSRNLYWGFRRRQSPNGLIYFEAEPEKALLDLLYLSRRTGEPLWIDLDLTRLDRPKLDAWAQRFPCSVARALQRLG